MRRILLLSVLFSLVGFCYAQNIGQEYHDFKVYKNFKKALRNKNKAVVLDLSDKKISSLPADIGDLQALKVLKL